MVDALKPKEKAKRKPKSSGAKRSKEEREILDGEDLGDEDTIDGVDDEEEEDELGDDDDDNDDLDGFIVQSESVTMTTAATVTKASGPKSSSSTAPKPMLADYVSHTQLVLRLMHRLLEASDDDDADEEEQEQELSADALASAAKEAVAFINWMALELAEIIDKDHPTLAAIKQGALLELPDDIDEPIKNAHAWCVDLCGAQKTALAETACALSALRTRSPAARAIDDVVRNCTHNLVASGAPPPTPKPDAEAEVGADAATFDQGVCFATNRIVPRAFLIKLVARIGDGTKKTIYVGKDLKRHAMVVHSLVNQPMIVRNRLRARLAALAPPAQWSLGSRVARILLEKDETTNVVFATMREHRKVLRAAAAWKCDEAVTGATQFDPKTGKIIPKQLTKEEARAKKETDEDYWKKLAMDANLRKINQLGGPARPTLAMLARLEDELMVETKNGDD